MVTNITTISVKPEDSEFLEQYNLKASELLRGKIAEIRGYLQGINKEVQEEQQRKIKNLMDNLQRYRDFLESKGLIDEFLNLKC